MTLVARFCHTHVQNFVHMVVFRIIDTGLTKPGRGLDYFFCALAYAT